MPLKGKKPTPRRDGGKGARTHRNPQVRGHPGSEVHRRQGTLDEHGEHREGGGQTGSREQDGGAGPLLHQQHERLRFRVQPPHQGALGSGEFPTLDSGRRLQRGQTAQEDGKLGPQLFLHQKDRDKPPEEGQVQRVISLEKAQGRMGQQVPARFAGNLNALTLVANAAKEINTFFNFI